MKSPFQLAILIVFGILGMVGVTVFALQSASKASEDVGDVSLWGTFPADRVNALLHELGTTEKQITAVTYQQHKPEQFFSDIATAIASEKGPDLIIIDDASVRKYAPTLQTIPFEQLSAATFQNTFIDSAQTFLTSEGSRGIPLAVDPLVLYWNKHLLSEHGFAVAPSYWAQIVDYAKEITVRDESGAITTSAVALGETSNINHADEIISAMILQAGGKVIVQKNDGTGLDVALGKSQNTSGQEGLSPAQAAVRAYTEFSNPAKRWYSWNKALKNSLDMFADGDLALYIGRSSEVNDIIAKNPNLVFGVSQIPRIRQNENAGDHIRTVTRGAVYALAIPKTAKNPSGAFAASLLLVKPEASKLWEEMLGMPSPHRSLLVEDPKDATKTTVRTAAIQMETFPNPDPAAFTDIFGRMIDRITSGAERISESLQRADAELKIIVRDTGYGTN